MSLGMTWNSATVHYEGCGVGEALGKVQLLQSGLRINLCQTGVSYVSGE